MTTSPVTIELLYFNGCPHHEAFLPHLCRLLREHGVEEPVRLVEITDDREAHRHRFLGSPTLRINGSDVDRSAADRTDYGMQCRIYRSEAGIRGTPPDPWIVRAIDGSVRSDRPGEAGSG